METFDNNDSNKKSLPLNSSHPPISSGEGPEIKKKEEPGIKDKNQPLEEKKTELSGAEKKKSEGFGIEIMVEKGFLQNMIHNYKKETESDSKKNIPKIETNPEKHNLIIPDHIKGVTLTKEQQKDLREGKSILLEGLTSKSGEKFNAEVKVNPEKKTLDFNMPTPASLEALQQKKELTEKILPLPEKKRTGMKI